ncbi:MAG TPA: tetratricopeptide repeat protein [Stellaceae bacterium]|nr:tetratricopeptide repeat protein [Stellaceae bacterium]
MFWAGAGVAATLVIVVGIKAATSPDFSDWLRHLRLTVAQKFAGPLASPAKVPSDPAGRLAYYTEHAKAGDADAQVALAVLYAKGDGVARDYAAAARWFKAAAEQGVVRAQYDLGVLFERGRGVPLDYAQAAGWYRKAADQNHPLAQYNLAVAYTKGEGLQQNFAEAAIWYRRAAAQGVIAAMVNLAILYERGEGLDVSPVDAYAWYRAAARRGSQPAARRADELLQAFSPADQTLAENRTADIAATIHDPVADRMRSAAAAERAPVSNTAASKPVFKYGIGDANGTQGGDVAEDTP